MSCTAIPGRVELLAVLPRYADVVDLDDMAGDRLIAIADGDVLELELIGRWLVGRDVDLGLFDLGHGPEAIRSRASHARRGRTCAGITRAEGPAGSMGHAAVKTPLARGTITPRARDHCPSRAGPLPLARGTKKPPQATWVIFYLRIEI